MGNTDEFYSKLKVQLDDTTNFPADYLYKFIVPTLENQVAEVKNIFDNTGAVIKTKKSKTGKYVSVSIILKLKTSEEVIVYYKKAAKIKGIISL
ncbi:MAG: putative lipoic acid-binding regulatory protein [Polaribacter sp.]|jgi:putative lipoic acid-binding regulatory protein|tara:strand:- start:4654 stop:4935 length:282 start_codon:yes stop_codon:yes gene_type:complete